MNVTKNVKFEKEANEDKASTSQAMATEDPQDITKIALTLAKDAITAAVKSAEEAENPVKNIDWITHGEFTEEKGRQQVEEFVLNWEYQDRWKHYTEFLRKEDMFHSFYYIYCVRWSIPTARRPIAQITASVYFTIKVNKNKPLAVPTRPGEIRFREKWLRDIIEAKYVLMNPNIFQFNSMGIFQNILGDF
ncbi:A-kinase anchor protein 14 [Capricornis sumatraensis]|uniref:A-kinase anchor protein 14 n=1 Tax=Capricornis sumatraensis TaxID=34865 RepID=UPI003604CD5B